MSEAVRRLLDETDIFDAHPAGTPQRTRGFPCYPARPHDYGVTLIEPPTAQISDRHPTGTPSGQNACRSQRGKQQQGGPRFVRIAEAEDHPHYE